MQTLRLVTVINAPVHRCYRLAMNAAMTREAMRQPTREGEPGATVVDEMALGAQLQWTGSRTGGVRETLTAMRAKVLIRRSLAGERLAWGEMEQHFAPMNDGTRLWEEIRFAVRGHWLRGFRERRMRRSLLAMMKTRTASLKEAAEGDGWKRFLSEE